DKGVPSPVERTLIAPPRCRMGALTPEERAAVRARSPVGAKYDTRVNRESAYEKLSGRAATAAPSREAPADAPRRGERAAPAPEAPPSRGTRAEPPAERGGGLSDIIWGTKRRQGIAEALAKQAARTVGSEIGRQILRGVLGGILGGS